MTMTISILSLAFLWDVSGLQYDDCKLQLQFHFNRQIKTCDIARLIILHVVFGTIS